MQKNFAHYVDAIRTACPDLSVETAEHRSFGGQYNDIVLVNGHLIFRFPKFAGGVTTLRREVRILNELSGRLPLPIPQPIFVSSSSLVGECFMGYQMIDGEPLWHPRFQQIEDERVRAQIGRQLADFLYALHTLPTAEFSDLPIEDKVDEWAATLEKFRTHLFPHMRPDARAAVSEQFDSFLHDPAVNQFDPALRHGDFGSGNLLFDAPSGRISGVIDFGMTCLGDPAVDIAAAMTFGEPFFKHYLIHYPQIERLLPRARFYRSTFALFEALYGVEHHDEKAFMAGMEDFV